MAACVAQVGGIPAQLMIVPDKEECLARSIKLAAEDYDFIITTGGASNGDYDFIKPVVEDLGDLYMTLVNMRPGKAQTFGVVDGTPVAFVSRSQTVNLIEAVNELTLGQ